VRVEKAMSEMEAARKGVRMIRLGLATAAFAAFLAAAPAAAQDVLTFHNNISHTGWDARETILTPANVGGVHLLHTVPVDSAIYAQPLVLGDRVYVATLHNTVYEINATTGQVVRSRHLGEPYPAAKMPKCGASSKMLFGVSSTPVIDPVDRALDLTSLTDDGVMRLRSLDLVTLADRVPPRIIAAQARLAGSNNVTIFNPIVSKQKASLLLFNGNIIAGFSMYCGDVQGELERGWVLAWNAATLDPTGRRLNDSVPQAAFYGAGVWGSGAGPVANENGNILFTTANSLPTGYNPVSDLSESVVEMSGDLSREIGHYTPAVHKTLDEYDLDFGAGGITSVPTTDYLVAAAKWGQMYLLNSADLGRSDPLEYKVGHCWCVASAYRGPDLSWRVVSSGGNQLIVWRLDRAALIEESTAPPLPYNNAARSLQSMSGFFTSVTSNGPSDAVIWAVARYPAPTLLAYDPADPAAGWKLNIPAGNWYQGGVLTAVPVVSRGRIFVAGQDLRIFGLVQ
jgi:hypothetical protein